MWRNLKLITKIIFQWKKEEIYAQSYVVAGALTEKSLKHEFG